MPELIGKLGYDGRGFSAGMNQALGEAKQASQKISGYFASAFSGGGGVGTVFGGVAGALGVQKLFDVVTGMADKVKQTFKDVKIGAAQLGTDIDTFQRIANITTRTGTGPETFVNFVEHLAVNLEK